MDRDRTAWDAFVAVFAASLGGNQPIVLETRRTVSLHFDLSATQSFMSLAEPERLVLEYTRIMMGFVLLAPAPARVLMIGLGGGSLAKYCHRHLPATTITAVEIDPGVIALRDRFHLPADGDRFEVICADGAHYMDRPEVSADVILLDAFEAQGISAQCASQSFLAACRERLRGNGVLVANFVDDDPALPVYLARVEAVFGMARAVLMTSNAGNCIVFAWNGASALPCAAVLAKRAGGFDFSAALGLHDLAVRLERGRRFEIGRLAWSECGRPRWTIKE
ncbi:spermidine synthase [Burkholderia glumae]|uniref:fused MFS/spermidine synthase n=1 Tax=Burkholderia glumae TaxID=337 RepID=UPI000F5EB4B9|nr:fused MFS/spermidine synthase [Burkholderia glumae]MCQ0029752.1 fused MFS/spermidine synthase [Burkholderia glumae]MCQ0038149.1 fused MFS/spermidine synthase [Burkholderia glumae]MCR1766025.1 fused MFS/spermidine synthase [Burkholderia glumae]QHP89890.1 spermidine synthase [Burkholderia glumae]QJP71690.1 fused MFS/spermidine synthase [Burkholderia glumae]